MRHADVETARATTSVTRTESAAVGASEPRAAAKAIPLPADESSVPGQIAALKREAFAVAEELCRERPGKAEPLFFLGKVHQRFGDSAAAVKSWEKGLAIDAKRPDAYAGLGWIAMLRGDQAEAVVHWERALGLDPKLPDLNNALARALMALGKTREAIVALERDVAQTSRPNASLFLIGQAYSQLKEYATAKGYYERVLALDPAATNAHFGLMQAAQRLGDKELAARHRAKFEELKAREMEELKAQESGYKDLATVSRETGALLTEAGRVWAGFGSQGKAEGVWRRAADIDRSAVDCRRLLATFYESEGRIADAIARNEELRALDPRDVRCRLALGQLYPRSKSAGALASAEAALKEAVVLAPQSAYPARDLALLYLRSRRHLQEGRALAEKAAALDPSAESFLALSRAYHMNGDKQAALGALTRAMQLEPAKEEYRKLYARIEAGE